MPAGSASLSGLLTYPERGRPTCAALIAGSHPLLGGNMSNNVIRALRLGLAERGVASLSFEYRGPSQRGGTATDWSDMVSDFWKTNHVPLESDWCRDAGAALAYLKRDVPGPVVPIGYSFGCWALAESSAGSGAAGLVYVSPNPSDHDFTLLQKLPAPLLVISSDNDFSCPTEKLRQWFGSLNGPREHKVFASAEHFFRGREAEVVGTVVKFLHSHGLIGA